MKRLFFSIMAAVALVAIPVSYLVVPSAAVVLTGCATPAKDADVLLLRAQQSRSIAVTTFDTFFNFELKNRAALFAKNPEIKHVADRLRADVPKAVDGINKAIDVYKASKSGDNVSALTTALAVLTVGLDEATKYLALSQTALVP